MPLGSLLTFGSAMESGAVACAPQQAGRPRIPRCSSCTPESPSSMQGDMLMTLGFCNNIYPSYRRHFFFCSLQSKGPASKSPIFQLPTPSKDTEATALVQVHQAVASSAFPKVFSRLLIPNLELASCVHLFPDFLPSSCYSFAYISTSYRLPS